MSVQPARRIALDVILAVGESDAYANLLLPVRLQRAKLSAADAGLATELTYGTLRMQGYYDAVIELAAGRSIEKIDPAILDVLRLACHQLLSMRVAQHAAVDESVQLAKTVGSNSAAWVSQVLPNGPANQAGVHVGDIITQIDDDAEVGSASRVLRCARCQLTSGSRSSIPTHSGSYERSVAHLPPRGARPSSKNSCVPTTLRLVFRLPRCPVWRACPNSRRAPLLTHR